VGSNAIVQGRFRSHKYVANRPMSAVVFAMRIARRWPFGNSIRT
jgi:hypothetical protein